MFFHKIIATGFGAGYSPIAPGTAGALVACAILWGLHFVLPEKFSGGWQQVHWLLLLIVVFFLLGVNSAKALEPAWGHDPSKIVVDEMVGTWIAMLGIPFSPVNLVAAFVLFRVFDIWKPLGIRRMEGLKRGWGVMMDDVVAGMYAGALLHLVLLLLSLRATSNVY